eukprot:TRINITY_DN28168_c0_g1_i1.p1 TRINITY_DN28168_c0_g1~~TRINITY_DN28168_c0_g1_i1.p1  ORF type:complete len:199 (+),score=31.76 TRINITY_DN28168_c0_g1_i1:58-597(+)
MIVFDLDSCLWDPEVYVLHGMPSRAIRGKLPCGNEGVVGAADGRYTVKLHPGSFVALNELRGGDIKVAAASSSLEPKYSMECLKLLEVAPGVNALSCFDYLQIGRTGKLTSRKTTHFKYLQQESGIDYSEMLFFDDCNWDDHVRDLKRTIGVVGVQTPNGLQVSDYRRGLELFAKERGG